ncbi:Nitrate reductase [NAD(P)H] [Platanthera guangdongensis]|uniref:Nitrate reductase [NAD(P)H] n=1 Tax=Platanthera guangdongensis TaxID=2320717 RepID=A0ABR2MTH0_9ASPA
MAGSVEHFPLLHSTPPPTTHQSSSSSSDEDDENINNYRTLLDLSPELPELLASSHDPLDTNTADGWIARHPSLIRLTGKHPFNSEPPLPLLMRHGFITPVPIHYVRNHGPVPGRTADLSTWTVEICGLVTRPAKFTVPDLARDFSSFQIPVTLVCAGNRRKEQNMVRQTVAFNWGPTSISTSVWRGVRLRDVLRRCGIMGRRHNALNVCFEGAEDLPGGGGGGVSKYGTSLRKEVAMDPSRDIMIAYMQNGELLTPDHGFPCRMIIPGFIGGRMVKWLTKITVTATESESYYHYKDNRVFPSHVDAELADAEGGGKKVTRVEISLDGGETWSDCALNHPEKPNRYGKYWCWCFWSLHIDPLRLLAADEIIVRAWDQTLNTQPQNLIWNLTGMMNNCWFRVRVTVRRPLTGDISIAFEHPTQPGNQPGGWMTPHKQLIQSGAPEKSVSGPPVGGIITSDALFSRDEIIVHDQVYDCTAFLKDHPGGADSILVNAGSDCSDDFDAIHSDKAKSMLAAYRIGRLKATSLAKSIEKIPVKLVAKTQITGDVRLFRFALPAADQLLGLRPGHHIFLSATINDKLCMRAYTPTSLEDASGYVELLIKIYDGGLMTQYLESLPLGAAMEINGPAGRIEYAGRGSFVIDGKTRRVTRVAMVAGGTGITLVYQIIRAMMREGDDLGIRMCLVYASRSEDDILMREDLDRWAREQPERLDVWYVVGEVRREEWGYSVGMVTGGVLREHIPMGVEEESLALVCGPLAMVQLVVLPALEKMKYEVGKSCFVF